MIKKIKRKTGSVESLTLTDVTVSFWPFDILLVDQQHA